jgi:translation initiation factor eIF-2B subunit delta
MAHNYHIPLIVCCETYKFTERVQLESISFNELGINSNLMCSKTAGDPDALLKSEDDTPHKETNEILKTWKDIPSLKLLNLMYDLTPCEFIAMVITEVGMVSNR